MIHGAEAAWLAGLIEGEGTIIFSKVNSVALNIFMTDEDVLLKCREATGRGSVRGPYLNLKRPGQKPIWKWSVTKADHVVEVLSAIRPWMGDRRTRRIDKALDRLSNVRGRAERLCDRGHYDWRPNKGGGRHCHSCTLDAQRVRRASDSTNA